MVGTLTPVPRLPQQADGQLDKDEAFRVLLQWCNDAYRILQLEAPALNQHLASLEARLDAIAAVGELSQTISGTPTQAEVQTVQNALNAVIAAAG